MGKQLTAAMTVAPATKSENTSTQKAGGAQEELAPVMSVVSYVILFILSAIPIVGIILILIVLYMKIIGRYIIYLRNMKVNFSFLDT